CGVVAVVGRLAMGWSDWAGSAVAVCFGASVAVVWRVGGPGPWAGSLGRLGPPGFISLVVCAPMARGWPHPVGAINRAATPPRIYFARNLLDASLSSIQRRSPCGGRTIC